MIPLLALTVLDDLVCSGGDPTVCYFTQCAKNETFQVAYRWDMQTNAQLTIFQDSLCQPTNVLIGGSLEISGIQGGALSAFVPNISFNLEKVQIDLLITIQNGWLNTASFCALYADVDVLFNDIIFTGSFVSMDYAQGQHELTFGGLVASLNKSAIIRHIGVYGVVVQATKSQGAGMLIGLLYNTTTFQVSHVIITSYTDMLELAHFDLDQQPLDPESFYCKSRNLQFELRMRQYLRQAYTTGDRTNFAMSGKAISTLIGNATATNILLSNIGIDADLGAEGASQVGFLVGYGTRIILMTIDSTHCQGTLDITSTGGAIGDIRSMKEYQYNFKISCAFNLSENVIGYVALIAQTQQGYIVLNAAIDVELKGKYTGGIVGILQDTNLTIAEVIGKVNILAEDSYQGLLVGKWTSSDYEIPRGYIDGVECKRSTGCQLNESDHARLNEQCQDA